jgi:hypothetical protein
VHPELTDSWVFKGGTCLKKCYFETYRFSEDLDFTLLDPTHLNEALLKRVFGQVLAWIYDRTGLDPRKARTSKCLPTSAVIPAARESSAIAGWCHQVLPRVKLDLTADERVVLAPVRVPIFTPTAARPATVSCGS